MLVTVHVPDDLFEGRARVRWVAVRIVGPERDVTIEARVVTVDLDPDSVPATPAGPAGPRIRK